MFFTPETLNPVFGNDLLEYLILKLDERFTLLTEVIMPKLKGKSDYSFSANQFRARWSRCQKMFLESFLVSGLLSHQVRKSTQEAKKLLRLSYPIVLETDLSLKQKIIFEVFKALDSSSGYYLFRYFAARKYFSNSKLKAVIAYDENSPLTKSILDAAKFCGIKIVGLQHGTMHDLHPAYLYTANDSKNRVMARPDADLGNVLGGVSAWERQLSEKFGCFGWTDQNRYYSGFSKGRKPETSQSDRADCFCLATAARSGTEVPGRFRCVQKLCKDYRILNSL